MDLLLKIHPVKSSEVLFLFFFGTIGQKWPQYKGLSPTPLTYLLTSVSLPVTGLDKTWQ
jgi:hypothetical protein